jgi:uncharacterized protein YprB with RNaseH-like and TPR domain
VDIKSRLQLYTKPQKEPKRESAVFDPASIGCEAVETGFGRVIRMKNRFSFDADYFGNRFAAAPLEPLLRLNRLTDAMLDELLFFDLETTSLSIAAGSYPFVCGIGFIDGDSFVTEQLFLESPAYEGAMLRYLLPFFTKSRAVVTFNGASFDMPMIKNRYMINRVYGFPLDIPVIDLLVPARRVFRNVYDSVSLQSMEKNILGFERVGDIPGFEIPDVYFSFQKTGDASRIADVIEHNRLDIITMLFLLSSLAKIFAAIDRKDFDTISRDSLFNLARHLYNADVSLFLELAGFLGPDIEEDTSVFEKFSIVLKREQEWERALACWESCRSLFSLREMAIYYEHRVRDFDKAARCCAEAGTLLEAGKFNAQGAPIRNQDRWREDFAKREARLLKKAAAS